MAQGTKIDEETRKKVTDAVNAGVRYSDIARSFGIGHTSVRRIAAAAGIKKSPAAVAAAAGASTENALITDTPIIADNAENVKVQSDESGEIPGIVRETVAREIDNLSNELEMLAERIKKVKADKAELEKWYLGTAPHIRYREENTE